MDKFAKKKKIIMSLFVSLILLVSGVAGTYAWLFSKTDPVVNTFTYGDVNLTLEESKVDENGNVVKDKDGEVVKTKEGNDYEMLPGKTYLKDPLVTVLEGNEACWLFIKVEEKGGVTITNGDGTTTAYDFNDYLDYTIEGGWNKLYNEQGVLIDGVYFRKVEEDADDTGKSYEILKDNKISVKEAVTKDMLNALDNNGQDIENATYPSLSMTAYAIQYLGFEIDADENAAALKAWKAINIE